jgi:hypothetical protein
MAIFKHGKNRQSHPKPLHRHKPHRRFLRHPIVSAQTRAAQFKTCHEVQVVSD